jgi:hypothetical protein
LESALKVALMLAVLLAGCITSNGEMQLTSTPKMAAEVAEMAGGQTVLPQLDHITFELVNSEPMRMDFPGGEELVGIEIVWYGDQIYYAYVLAVNPGVSFGHYFAVSTNGIDWVVDQEPIEFPIVHGKEQIRLDLLQPMTNGGWRLITTHFEYAANGRGIHQEIWALRSASIEGPWTLEVEPLLEPSEAGSWDQNGVQFTALYWDDELFYLLYGSSDLSFQGLAISSDGGEWSKILPEGVSGPYLEENNVILMEQSDGIWYPQLVWRTTSGWQMIYLYSQGQRYSIEEMRSAVSSDGVTWEPIEAEFEFENLDENQISSISTSFWIGDQLHITYCIWDEGEVDCFLGRLVDNPPD